MAEQQSVRYQVESNPLRAPPPHIIKLKTATRSVHTFESLQEKQKLAEERRKAQREAKLERIRQREEEALSITKALHPMVANGRASEAELRRAMKAAKAMVSMTSQVAKEFAQHSES